MVGDTRGGADIDCPAPSLHTHTNWWGCRAGESEHQISPPLLKELLLKNKSVLHECIPERISHIMPRSDFPELNLHVFPGGGGKWKSDASIQTWLPSIEHEFTLN